MIPTRILSAIEMVGTYNALESAYKVLTGKHRGELSFAAAGALEAKFKKDGVSHYTVEDEVEDVLDEQKPDLVIVGVVAGVKDAGGSGIERTYALAALDRGIPVVTYRDFFGLHPWFDRVTSHPNAGTFLHFFVFDESTVRLIRGLELPCAEAISVGSGYYDADVSRDWSALRVGARDAMGWTNDDLVVVFSPGSRRDRVLETLESTVDGIKSAEENVVFVTTFHPKDPDAPYVLANPSTRRPSAAYDPVIDRLNDSDVRVIREPEFRNTVPDNKARVAAADFIVMNPLSIDTYSALFAGTPAVITGLPLTQKEAEEGRNNFREFDFVRAGAMDLVATEEGLARYMSALPSQYGAIRERLTEAAKAFRPRVATPHIVENLLRVANG